VAAVTAARRGGLVHSLFWAHRLEFPFSVSYPPHAVWGALWAVTQPRQLLAAPVLALAAANVSHLLAQNAVNTALDVDADARNPEKRVLAGAAQRLGRRALLGMGSAEWAVSVLLAAGVSAALSRPSIVAWMAVIVALQVLYNVEPVHLKRRGMANPVTLALTYTVLPALPVYLAVRPAVSPAMWLVLLGMLFVATGRILWWAIPDRAADLAANWSTPVVRLGFVRSLLVAGLLSTVGTALVGGSLWWRYGAAWALLGIAAASLFPLFALRRFSRASTASTDGGSMDGHFHAVRLRRRDLPLSLAADLSVAVIPLAVLLL